MAVSRHELMGHLNTLLQPHKIKDYCPNGLQVEGTDRISKIVTGVTASQALIDAAVAQNADALLVHHGFFWKGENPCITGMKGRRIKALLAADINLIAYHLPLDVHPEHGNNAQLGKLLGLQGLAPIADVSPDGVLWQGRLPKAASAEDFASHIQASLHRAPLMISAGEQPIETVAWCTGGGQGYIDQAAELGVDAFISGEASEQTVHSARETGTHFFAAGHHATERYGAKALGESLQQQFDVEVVFIDIANPV